WQNFSSAGRTLKFASDSFARWLQAALLPSSGRHWQIWLARVRQASPQPAASETLSTQANSRKALTAVPDMAGRGSNTTRGEEQARRRNALHLAARIRQQSAVEQGAVRSRPAARAGRAPRPPRPQRALLLRSDGLAHARAGG